MPFVIRRRVAGCKSWRVVCARKLARAPRLSFLTTDAVSLPEVQNRIFEAGFSGNGQTPGLGLAVCREIVEQHGGTIRVSSVLGEGTSFVVELPAAS